jgi:hypothetical protein
VKRVAGFAIALAASILWLGQASAAGQRAHAAPPGRPGTCAYTRVTDVGRRIADSGTSVELANGVVGISYEEVEAVRHSRRGDRVFTCLISIPRGCPPGDARGRMYTTTNLRTEESWTLPDSQHACGGA